MRGSINPQPSAAAEIVCVRLMSRGVLASADADRTLDLQSRSIRSGAVLLNRPVSALLQRSLWKALGDAAPQH